jgi:GNAT superfamily N-acetyltransferase
LLRGKWVAAPNGNRPRQEDAPEKNMNNLMPVSVQTLDLNNAALCESAWQCYQGGFAGKPWNEWKQCATCDTSFGLSIKEQKACPKCGNEMTLYWPTERISKDIRKSLSLPKSYCSVAVIGNKVVGLVLGYVLSPTNLSEELGILIPCQHPEVAYQDEVVVHPDFQGHGIGRILYDHWMAWVATEGLLQVIARTLSEPPSVVYQWYGRLNYSVVAEYPFPDHRVILSLNF